MGIGTDGPASNNDLDMFEELRLAALLAKGAGHNPTALPAREALAMATRMGARAIRLGAVTGSLEPGKRADLIVVDLDQPITLRDSGATRLRCTRRWCTPPKPRTSSTSCAMGSG